MDDARFQEIASTSVPALRTLLTMPKEVLGGEVILYNAYVDDLEVVVLGFSRPDPEDPGVTVTRPIAILVDPEVFSHLRVDQEVGRVDGEGNNVGPLLKEDA